MMCFTRIVLLLALCFYQIGYATNNLVSSVWSGIGEGAHGANGVIILGVDSKDVSGYYESSDTTGTTVAECKFYFFGQLSSINSADVRIITAYPDFISTKPTIIKGNLEIRTNTGKPILVVYPRQIPPSCDWLYNGLPSYISPKNFKLKDGLPNDFERKGDWHAINIIQSERAYLYREPNETTKSKAFVVRGDLIYIYEESRNWYYVRFHGQKKDSIGWVKKSDTFQFAVRP